VPFLEPRGEANVLALPTTSRRRADLTRIGGGRRTVLTAYVGETCMEPLDVRTLPGPRQAPLGTGACCRGRP
jgi:hypothetical protein